MTQILTFLGKSFDLVSPDPDQIDPRDIAHALANACRFGGHTRKFYSVAQHSCIVADLVPEPYKLAALLHDATEAYCGDMVRPLKEIMPQYRAIERGIWEAICRRFWLNPVLPVYVLDADMIALATERRDLMPATNTAWLCLEGVEPMSKVIRPWDQARARDEYFQRLMDQLAVEHRRKAGEVIAQAAHRNPTALLRSAAHVDAQKTNSCCEAASIISSPSATAEAPIPHKKLRGAATSEYTLNAQNCPPAQPVKGYTPIPFCGISLKSCPFCGSPAAFSGSDNGNWIECTSERCGSSTNIRYSMGEDCRPLLAEQWNSRAPHTDTQLIEWLDMRGALQVDPESSAITFPHSAATDGYDHIREAITEAFTQDHGGEL